MSIYLVGAAWVLGIGAVAASVVIPVRRFSGGAQEVNDAVTGVFTIVAGLHAVLIAFVLISLFDTAGAIEDVSYAEANALVAVYRASDPLPAETRDEVQQLCRSYAQSVVNQEWPSMRAGDSVDDGGWGTLVRVQVAVDAALAVDGWQQERKSEAADQLWKVNEARQARLAAEGSGVSVVVWLALIVGSILSISLAYLFDVSKIGTHMVIIGILAGTIALLLFAIYQLQNPFTGGASVEPDAFVTAVDRMQGPAQ